jgi:hypothetical protein
MGCCIFKINVCWWWGFEHLFYLMGHWGMRLKILMCHGGNFLFLMMGGCRF